MFFLAFCLGGPIGIYSPSVIAETWKSGAFSITLEGHQSSQCNPRSGDSVNLERCSLKVHIDRLNHPWADLVLPWQTASIEEVAVVDTKSILFVGLTQSGFHQITAFDIDNKVVVYKQLAAKVAISPEHDFVAYQIYQPPHGPETPSVQVGVLPTKDMEQFRAWKPQTIFEQSAYEETPGKPIEGAATIAPKVSSGPIPETVLVFVCKAPMDAHINFS